MKMTPMGLGLPELNINNEKQNQYPGNVKLCLFKP